VFTPKTYTHGVDLKIMGIIVESYKRRELNKEEIEKNGRK
jgi:hypothetical protein